MRVYLDKEKETHIFEIMGRNIEHIDVEIKTTIKETKKYVVVRTYREIYKERKLIKKEKLSKDKYKKN